MWTNLIDFIKTILPIYHFKIHSFTYFLPSPPPRSTGFREKQFDKVFYNFINKGFKIISVNSNYHNDTKGASGIWLIFTVQARNSKAEKFNLNDLPDNIDYLEDQNYSFDDE